jgi:hypothetical protein
MKMQNKHLPITFNDLSNSTQQLISTILAQEACKRMKTPPTNDPCADPDHMAASVHVHLTNFGDDTLFDLDIEEVGTETGILK